MKTSVSTWSLGSTRAVNRHKVDVSKLTGPCPGRGARLWPAFLRVASFQGLASASFQGLPKMLVDKNRQLGVAKMCIGWTVEVGLASAPSSWPTLAHGQTMIWPQLANCGSGYRFKTLEVTESNWAPIKGPGSVVPCRARICCLPQCTGQHPAEC